MHRLCCSVRGQRPRVAWSWLSDCSSRAALSSLCSATAPPLLRLYWPRRSDACTLQVNKKCHWQRGKKQGPCRERWKRAAKQGMKEGWRKQGKEVQKWKDQFKRDKREEQKLALAVQVQRSCCTQALSLKDQRAGITVGHKQGVVTGRGVIFLL